MAKKTRKHILFYIFLCVFLNNYTLWATPTQVVTEPQQEVDCDHAFVNIHLGLDDTVCEDTTVIFNAMTGFVGDNALFQWFIDGQPVDANGTTCNVTLPNSGQLSVRVTPKGCDSISATYDLSSIPTIKRITPSIEVEGMPNSLVCKLDTIQLTALAKNVESTPTYTWMVNGEIQATLSPTEFEWTNFHDQDVLSIRLHATDKCVTQRDTTVQIGTIRVRDVIKPTIKFINSFDRPFCMGDSVDLIAQSNLDTLVNYEWYVDNQLAEQTTQAKWKTEIPPGDHIVFVKAITQDKCASPGFAMDEAKVEVRPKKEPSLKIIPIEENEFCQGTKIYITTEKWTNGGAEPKFQWFVNNEKHGEPTLSSFFSFTPTQHGALNIKVEMESNYACPDPKTATDSITVNVQQPAEPTVKINGLQNPICAIDTTTLTVISENAGLHPSYQWLVDGQNTGQTGTELHISGEYEGKIVSVIMTSDYKCRTKDTASDSTETILITPPIKPEVTIGNLPTEDVCVSEIKLSAKATNGGSNPSYKWLINGEVQLEATDSVFTPNYLTKTDIVTVELTSSEQCVHPNPITAHVSNINAFPLPDSVQLACNCPNNEIFVENVAQLTLQPNDGSGSWNITPENIVKFDPKTREFIGLALGTVTFSYAIENEYGCQLTASIDIAIRENNHSNDDPNSGSNNNTDGTNNGGGGTTSSSKPGTIWETHPLNTDPNDSLFLIPNFLVADGNNSFVISHLSAYPQSTLQIYNRWGMLVHESADYRNDWQGTINGEELPTATYYFILNRNDTDKYTLFKGFIHLSH